MIAWIKKFCVGLLGFTIASTVVTLAIRGGIVYEAWVRAVSDGAWWGLPIFMAPILSIVCALAYACTPSDKYR